MNSRLCHPGRVSSSLIHRTVRLIISPVDTRGRCDSRSDERPVIGSPREACGPPEVQDRPTRGILVTMERQLVVSDEVRAEIGGELVATMSQRAKTDKVACRICDEWVGPDEDIAIVVLVSERGGSVGFTHLRCGPSVITDRRGDAAYTAHFTKLIAERQSGMTSRPFARTDPAPRSWVILEPDVPMFVTPDGSPDSINANLASLLDVGFSLASPPLIDFVAPRLDDWVVTGHPGEVIVRRSQDEHSPFFEGGFEIDDRWFSCAEEDHGVMVLVGIGTGMDVDHAFADDDEPPGWMDLLEEACERGRVVAATVAFERT